MTEPTISVMDFREYVGWPDDKRTAQTVRELSLSEALIASYTTDAHLVQYTSVRHSRLKRAAIKHGVQAEIGVVLFDVDDPATHGTKEPASEVWRSRMRWHLRHLSKAHPNPYYFETRGGARIVYRQPKLFVVSSLEAERIWKQRYLVTIAYLARRFNINADPSCADWTRTFRLPRVVREGKREQWETIGDAKSIGELNIRAEPEDLEMAIERSSKAFDENRAIQLAPCVTTGEGLLYYALRARGLVLGQKASGYLIQCPQQHLHTSGRVGDTSTMLFPPAYGERIGAIHCLHGHCAHMRVKDWLKCFSREELKSASREAGLEP